MTITTEAGGMEAGRDALCADVRDLFDRAIEEDGRMCDAQVPLDNLCGAVVGRILQTFAALATARPKDVRLKLLRERLDAQTDHAAALSSIIWCISHSRPLREELRAAAPHSFGLAEEYIERGAALATARPALTEDMIEAACRAHLAANYPNVDADLQVARGRGRTGTWPLWETQRHFIEPALKAALDRAAAPQSEEARHDD